MSWFMAVLIALWGVPLAVIALAAIGCLLSSRIRLAIGRLIGLSPFEPDASPQAADTTSHAR